jgi:hypothetical protein
LYTKWVIKASATDKSVAILPILTTIVYIFDLLGSLNLLSSVDKEPRYKGGAAKKGYARSYGYHDKKGF